MTRILVIDDEELIRGGLQLVLEQEGYTVLLAENGRAGVDLHRRRPCTLAIVDILMPEQDGLETIMALRQLTPAIKIITISGGGRFGLMSMLEVRGGWVRSGRWPSRYGSRRFSPPCASCWPRREAVVFSATPAPAKRR